MKKTLLAVLAHPDDESYGIGGTLARYAAEGVDVHVAIATDGAAGSIDKKWQGDRSRLVDARTEEVSRAADVLGVTLHLLGYGDSGYIGDPANEDPNSFVNADQDEAICQVVKLIREVRPEVVITHDETGGYYHPDHIQCNTITTPGIFCRREGGSLSRNRGAAVPTTTLILQRLFPSLGEGGDVHDAPARDGIRPRPAVIKILILATSASIQN